MSDVTTFDSYERHYFPIGYMKRKRQEFADKFGHGALWFHDIKKILRGCPAHRGKGE